jgi:hypothetical protein
MFHSRMAVESRACSLVARACMRPITHLSVAPYPCRLSHNSFRNTKGKVGAAAVTLTDRVEARGVQCSFFDKILN